MMIIYDHRTKTSKVRLSTDRNSSLQTHSPLFPSYSNLKYPVNIPLISEKNLTDNIADWIGLRENLQETIDFPIKYGAFL